MLLTMTSLIVGHVTIGEAWLVKELNLRWPLRSGRA